MNCHDMKKDETYECTSCGLKLQVVQNCDCNAGECTSCEGPELTCCGSSLSKS